MKPITATVIYYVPGPFGPLQRQHDVRQVFHTETDLRSAVRNADSVLSRGGAGHIVLDQDRCLAVQVSGYSWNRGAFVDVVPRSELEPYLKEAKA